MKKGGGVFIRLFIASGFSAPVIEHVKEIQVFAAPRLGRAVKWVEVVESRLTSSGPRYEILASRQLL